MQDEHLHQYSRDLLTLALLWERSFTATVRGYTFMVSCERMTVDISRRCPDSFGPGGSELLAVVTRFQSGVTEMQSFLTAPST